ncbi:MAG: AAA family ATPase [Saprospiraceae bacterium]|nr:AAA family ATPase [Saprospiraceae bacterium]
MREERRILQKEVFPKLEIFCEAKHAKFQAVDLRWGVNEETTLKQETLELCLKEIDRCQRISPKPNFVILLGDKYGWQPIPSKIPEDEMKLIHPELSENDKNLINNWYWLDENAIPAEYVLQPRENEYKEFKKWEFLESNIRDFLRKAVFSSHISIDKKLKYFSSATHQEIIRGALKPYDDGKNPEEHVFAFVRKTNGLPLNNAAEGFIDLDKDGFQNSYSKDQLNDLKNDLETKLKSNYLEYDAKWIDGKSHINNVEEFANKAYKYIEDIIQSQLNDLHIEDELNYEINLHREFKNRLNEHFKGREEILAKVKEYINNPEDKKVFSLIGDSGTGKSSVMAQAILQNENAESNTAYRFIGTTSKTTNLESLLRNLCDQIVKTDGKDMNSFIEEADQKSLHEINTLTRIFRKCLTLGTVEKPILIFLDALDQLSDSGSARSLYWLPKDLPDHVKIVVSSTPELDKSLLGTHIENLSDLSEEEARLILDQWFEVAQRRVTPQQYDFVIEKFNKTQLPLYLKLAFENVRHWQSYDKALALKDDVKGIINDFFVYLEKEHTKELVTNVICYMLCGRYQGLAESEILEILVFDKDYWNIFLNKSHESHRDELEGVTKIPIIVWSRLFLDLEPFLTEKDADGVSIINFFHKQFVEVLTEKYGLTTEIT